MAGLLAVLNGWLNLAIANCGPGTGNGVLDGAAAFVLGMIDVAVGGLALTAPGQLLGLPAWLGRFARDWLLLITGLSAGRPGRQENSDGKTATKNQLHRISKEPFCGFALGSTIRPMERWKPLSKQEIRWLP